MVSMNTIASAEANVITGPPKKKTALKPCCVCKETKRARDECIIQYGEKKCASYIEAHKDCMRKMGFRI